MRRANIEQQNKSLLEEQRRFRVAADVVTDAWMAFPEVQAIAVIGSVAKALWKEVPRFSDFRREGIEVWHECRDLDLALWIDSQHVSGRLREQELRADRLSQPRDVVLQRGSRRLRWRRPPDLVNEPVARDGLVCVEEQEGEQGSHPLPVQGNKTAVLDDCERSENAKFDGNTAVLALASPAE